MKDAIDTQPEQVKDLELDADELDRVMEPYKWKRIEDGIEIIGVKDENVASLRIPFGVTVIGGNAFYNCENLRSVELPEGLTVIGNNAFSLCKSLDIISIPSSVRFIEKKPLVTVTTYSSFNCPRDLPK